MMKNKSLLICLFIFSFLSGCKDDNYETWYIPEYEKFVPKVGAQLIFQNEAGISDTFVVDSVKYITDTLNYGNDIEKYERVCFRKPNSVMPFKYSFNKYNLWINGSGICSVDIFFNNHKISNYYQDPDNSILINYKVNNINYPYVEYIKTTTNDTIWEIFYNAPYGIIKYRLQDSIVWSLNNIIE